MTATHFKRFVGMGIGFLMIFMLGCQENSTNKRYWHTYKADKASTSYSSLSQINRTNVQQLEVAWQHEFDDVPVGERFGKYECNPIVVDGVIYLTSTRNWLYALDVENGEELWRYDPFDGERGGGIKRGVTYWEDSDGEDQRILSTADHYLYAVDAKTGLPIETFGSQGRVNLNEGLGVNPDSFWVKPTSPGIIYQDLIIIGGMVSESYDAAPGHIRAYDIRTGEIEWIFHTIPQPGEPGYDTWPADAWKTAGGANNWAGMSLDEKRGMVFIPLGSPTYDFYGANRKGENLYGNCLVALNAQTGELVWHFQTVHHDLWDYDLPAPPTLATIDKEGKTIDVVTLATKTGFLFVFDRETGNPIFPIEERKVPSSNVPGEYSWPTQPFPTLPSPFVRQKMTTEEVADLSPQARDSILNQLKALRYEGLFTPPDIKGTLMLPGTRGGAEWGGSAYDPQSGILYLNANESPELITLEQEGIQDIDNNVSAFEIGQQLYLNKCASCHGKNLEGQASLYPSLVDLPQRKSENESMSIIQAGLGRMPSFSHISEVEQQAIMAYLYEKKEEQLAGISEWISNKPSTASYRNVTAYSYFRGPEGHPAIKPPWGTLNAIDLSTGEYLWKIPLGNHPEVQQEGAPPTGAENWGGPIATAGGLIFIAATRDGKFRAFDSKTGEQMWETTLPGPGYAVPMTYMANGRQYIAIAVTGTETDPGGSLQVFALPD